MHDFNIFVDELSTNLAPKTIRDIVEKYVHAVFDTVIGGKIKNLETLKYSLIPTTTKELHKFSNLEEGKKFCI